MLATTLRRLYHACWYIIAALVLTTAVFVTLIRVTLPHIDNYREEIQDWAGKYVGYSIVVEKIDAEWRGWTPYLRLHGINVLDQAGKNTLARLKTATISLNPATTFISQNLSPLQITISGPELVIIRGTDGAINIAQIESGDSDQYGINKHSVFAEWLLTQKSVSIQDAKIHYLDQTRRDTPLLLTNVTLFFKRSWQQIQIDASAILPELYGKSFNISMDIFGDITTPQWSGQIYFNGQGIYPGKLIDFINSKTSSANLISAPADIYLWSNWKDGKPNNLDGRIDVSAIQFEYAKLWYDIQHLDTLFSIRRSEDDGFRLRLNIEDLVTTNGRWPKTSIEFHKEWSVDSNNFRYIAKSDYLKIEDLIPLIKAINTNHGFYKDTLYKFSGALKNSVFVYDNSLPEPVYVDSNVDKLTIEYVPDDSSISNLSGHIKTGLQNGLISLDSDYIELSLPDIFPETIMLYELAGDVNWKNENDALIFETRLVESHTPYFDSSINGKISFNLENSAIYTNLLFNAGDLDIENLVHYMPVNTPEGLQAWIKKALVSGRISSLDISLRGNLDDFPFKNMEGQFKTIANIQNTTMDYHPEWTPLDKLDAELVIENNRLSLNAHSGYIYNAGITEATAVVEELDADAPTINIKGNIKGTTQDAVFIVNNSPLSSSNLLKEINDIELDGSVTLDLNLHIPLDHKPLSINGDLFFDKAYLKSPALGMELDDISGNVLFTADSVSTKNLTGNYFNQQVNLGISAGDEERLFFSLTGDSDSHFIVEQLVYFFPGMRPITGKLNDIMDGVCRWTATIAPDPSASAETARAAKLLTINSDLSGLKINLPAPLKKEFDIRPLAISTTFSEAPQKEIYISMGDDISGRVHLNQAADTTLTMAELALGNNTGLFNDRQGIFVHGTTDQLSLSDWHNLIDTLDLGITAVPVQVDLQVSTLGYYDQQFTDTSFKLNNEQSQWEISFNGADIEGDFIIPGNSGINTVTATFNKLHLQSNSDSENEFNIDPRQQPPIELTVEDFSYGNISLGNMILNTSKREEGLSIDALSFSKPGLTINGNGLWQIINDLEFSKFEFQLSADKLKNMLKTFDYSIAPVKDGATSLELNASWNGSPMDFSLENINGTLDMNIEKGQFLNIEPTAGRLFGLLSIQTLPRRLSLDFSDLFDKGFSFDLIEGSFTLESGNAYTNNLTMAGPSASIGITGRTGLIEKDYDQIVTVTPQVSDSLPLASALFGPIGAGVGAVIFLAGELFQAIPKQIDKFLRYQYTVRGNWEDPVVEKYQGEGSG